MNVFNFTGNLGKDCEIRYTNNSDHIANFSVGVSSGFGEKAVTTWVNCSLWGKRAEALSQYLTKGQQVAISGELTNRKYVDKQGVEKYSLEVRVNDITLTGGKQANSEARQPAGTQSESNLPDGGSDFDDTESDIPF